MLVDPDGAFAADVAVEAPALVRGGSEPATP